HVAGRKCFVELVQFELDVLDVGEPLNSQEFLRDVLRRHTDARYANQSDPRRLRRGLRGNSIASHSQKCSASSDGCCAQKLSLTPAVVALIVHKPFSCGRFLRARTTNTITILRFQFFLQLLPKPPVGPLRDYLLRTRLD